MNKNLGVGVTGVQYKTETDGTFKPIPEVTKEPEIIEIAFSQIPIGTKFKLNNILHKKTSATATYGMPINKNLKGKKGIYLFNPDTKLTFKKSIKSN